MTTEISVEGHKLGIRDSDTGESLPTLKAVDFTDDCPNRLEGFGLETALMLFGRAQRGRIVQFDLGSRVHFFVDELDAEMNMVPQDDTFGSRASMLGLTKQELRELVERHAPA